MGIQFYSQGGNPYSNQNADLRFRLWGTAIGCKEKPKPEPKPEQKPAPAEPKPLPKDSTVIKRDTIQPTYYGGWCNGEGNKA